MSDNADKVAQFVTITGAPASLAESLLAACDGSLEMALNMHMEEAEANPGLHTAREDVDDVGPSRPRSGGSGGGGRRTTNRNNSNSSRRDGDEQQGTSSRAAANNAFEDDDDDVRAPIPQRQEKMIEAGYEGYHLRAGGASNPHRSRVRTVFDGFRNFSAEAQTYGEGSSSASSSSGRLPVDRGKKRTLEELFKPPIDLTFKGDWRAARDTAEVAKKWLLVNIQDAGEFQCQVLNRDVWSSEAVKTIVREHFIFWQQYREGEEAQRYLTFYPAVEWPHVAVLDPRTGEMLVTWNKVKDAGCFCELVSEFLTLHPPMGQESSSSSASSSAPARKKARTEAANILDADEDDQLAAAIQASLTDCHPSSSDAVSKAKASSGVDLVDSDGSDFEPFSGEESNMSVPTPVKQRSKANSRAVSPEPTKNGKHNGEKKTEEENGASKESSATTAVDGSNGGDEWTKYLGGSDDPKSSILIRFPDGRRESKSIPCTSQFRALVSFVESSGFPLERHEIVTNFPRRILTDLDPGASLKDLGLFPQETVFVQEKSK